MTHYPIRTGEKELDQNGDDVPIVHVSTSITIGPIVSDLYKRMFDEVFIKRKNLAFGTLFSQVFHEAELIKILQFIEIAKMTENRIQALWEDEMKFVYGILAYEET